MRKLHIAALAALGLASTAFAAPAFAQSQGWMSVSQVESRLTSQGFRVLEIERDDGHFEVKAFDANGRCVEIDVNRSSGEIIRTKSDDDCGRDDRSSRR